MESLLPVIFGGIGVGFLGCAIALRMIYTNLRKALESRISTLEKALGSAQEEIRGLRDFERETLIGLMVEANTCMVDCHKAGRKSARMVEILRQRFGDGVLLAVQEAKEQAEAELAATDVFPKAKHFKKGG
jgi:hypothetical protein